MTLEERLLKFKSLGWSYNESEGLILSHKGTPVKYHICTIQATDTTPRYDVTKAQLAYFLKTGEIPSTLYFIDKNRNNVKWNNISIYKIYKGGRPREDEEIEEETTTNIYKQRPVIQYTKGVDLTYQIILSLGKGKLTKEAEKMLIKIVNNLSYKFRYYYDADRQDCISEAYYGVLKGWRTYDPDRYDNAFPYITEIAKRSFVKGLAVLQGKNASSGITPSMVSLNKWDSYEYSNKKNY